MSDVPPFGGTSGSGYQVSVHGFSNDQHQNYTNNFTFDE